MSQELCNKAMDLLLKPWRDLDTNREDNSVLVHRADYFEQHSDNNKLNGKWLNEYSCEIYKTDENGETLL